jgi:hypothetical protein
MSFEPASPISIITCEHCQGTGCRQCDNHGIYALQDDQPIAFNLPDFIDLKARRFLKKIFYLKRTILVITALVIIFLTRSLLL